MCVAYQQAYSHLFLVTTLVLANRFFGCNPKQHSRRRHLCGLVLCPPLGLHRRSSDCDTTCSSSGLAPQYDNSDVSGRNSVQSYACDVSFPHHRPTLRNIDAAPSHGWQAGRESSSHTKLWLARPHAALSVGAVHTTTPGSEQRAPVVIILNVRPVHTALRTFDAGGFRVL